MTYDAGWLLSTVAQSSAALVGTLSGFLVVRTVATRTTLTEREDRASDAASRHRTCASRLKDREKHLAGAALDLYSEHALRALVDRGGRVSIETLGDLPPEVASQDAETRLDQLRGIVVRAFEVLDAKVPESARRYPPRWNDAKRDYGIHLTRPGDDEWYEVVYHHVRLRNLARSRARFVAEHGGRAVARAMKEYPAPEQVDIYGRRIRRAEEELARARQEVDVARRDHAEAEDALRRAEEAVRRVKDEFDVPRVLRTVFVLAVAGIAVPVALLGVGTVGALWYVRAAVTGLFLLGVYDVMRSVGRFLRGSWSLRDAVGWPWWRSK